MSIIDAGSPATWPADLRQAVDCVAELHEPMLTPSDLWLGDRAEAAITAALAGVNVRLFHSTRLLPCEVSHVLEDGLRPLNEQLINRKINCAIDAEVITAAEAEVLRETHVLVTDSYGSRRDRVCAVLTTYPFEQDPHGVERLLTFWGGEALYWLHTDEPSGQRLRELGQPAIVECSAPAAQGDLYFPALPQVLVAAALGMPEVEGEVHVRRPIPAQAIQGVWTPGTPQYDRFPLLPRQ